MNTIVLSMLFRILLLWEVSESERDRNMVADEDSIRVASGCIWLLFLDNYAF